MRRFATALLLLVTFSAAAQTLSWRDGDKPSPLEGWRVMPSTAGNEAKALSSSNGFMPYEGGALPANDADGRMYAFRADFTLGGADPERPLALYMGPGEYPRDVYVNGSRLLMTGRHGDRYVATIFYSSRIPLPPELLRWDGQLNEVTILAYPAYETAPLGDVVLGDYYDISGLVFMRDLFNIHFIRAAMILAGFIGLYFLLLYARSPDKDIRFLFFALTCAGFVLGHVNLSFYSDAANDVLLLKLSRTGLVLTGLFFAFFSMRFSGVLSGKRWLYTALAVPTGLSIALNWLQEGKEGASFFFSSVTTNFVLTPLLVFTLVILALGVFRRRDIPSLALLLGYGLAIAASLADMITLANDVIPFCYLLAYGYTCLLLSIFFILALEQSATARELSLQTGRLNERNATLRTMVQDLSEVAAGLVSSSGALDGTIRETISSVVAFSDEAKLASAALMEQTRALGTEMDSISLRMAEQAERMPKALDSQAQAVASMNRTLSDMQDRMTDTLGAAESSNAIAGELAAEADAGSAVIAQSRNAMGRVAELSASLQAMLSSIEDIAERTHVLSINAAIESARMGNQGRGFSVIAQEIRTLSERSRTSLASSFSGIGEISASIASGAELSDQAAEALAGIARKARTSASKTEGMRELIQLQREQGSRIVSEADSLLADSRLIKTLSDEEKRSSGEREEHFMAMKEALGLISNKLEGQDARTRALSTTLDTMRTVSADTAEQIRRLKLAIAGAQEI